MKTKQGWKPENNTRSINTRYPGIRGASIDIGAYPASSDPTYFNNYAMEWPFVPSDDLTTDQAEELLKKWASFVSNVSSEISGTFYSLIPGLQTSQSVQSYGLTQRMVYSLRAISSYLDNPEQFKTVGDVYRIIAPIAIKIFDEDINERPQSGLYKNWKKLGWGTDVM